MITEAGGPHRCPSPTLQSGVCKSLGFFTSSFSDSPEIGWGWKLSQISLRCPLGSQCEAEHLWGPGIQNLCFRTLAHWESVTSRFLFFFLLKGEVHYTLPPTGRKEARGLATHPHSFSSSSSPVALRLHSADKYACAPSVCPAVF